MGSFLKYPWYKSRWTLQQSHHNCTNICFCSAYTHVHIQSHYAQATCLFTLNLRLWPAICFLSQPLSVVVLETHLPKMLRDPLKQSQSPLPVTQGTTQQHRHPNPDSAHTMGCYNHFLDYSINFWITELKCPWVITIRVELKPFILLFFPLNGSQGIINTKRNVIQVCYKILGKRLC